MVKNYGGYTPSYGSSAAESTAVPKPSPRPEAVAIPIVESPSRKMNNETERRNADISRVVGATLSLALDGKTLPLDVARTLLNKDIQQQAISRVHTSLQMLQGSGQTVDLMAAAERLSNLDETVLDLIKQS